MGLNPTILRQVRLCTSAIPPPRTSPLLPRSGFVLEPNAVIVEDAVDGPNPPGIAAIYSDMGEILTWNEPAPLATACPEKGSLHQRFARELSTRHVQVLGNYAPILAMF
jgi:hypothetical protein